MFCKNCGSELREGAAFCAGCGIENKQTVVNNSSLESKEVVLNGQPKLNNETKKNTGSNKNKSNALVKVIAIILTMILVAACIILITSRLKQNKINNYIEEGSKYLQEKNIKKAASSFNEAVSIDELMEETYIKIKDLFIEYNRLDDAYNIINVAIKNGADDSSMNDIISEIEQKFEITTINQEVSLNEKYELPKKVSLTLNNEEKVEASIKWKTSLVNTDKTGTFEFEGTASKYGRPVKLILTVQLKIIDIPNIKDTVLQEQAYILPKQVQAIMSDDSKIDAEVTWDIDKVDTSMAGIQQFEGSVDGYENIVKLTLTIKEKEVIISKKIGILQRVYEKDGKRYMELDEFEWYSGDEALEEAKKDGQDEVPNDYYTRNPDNILTTYELSPNATYNVIAFSDSGLSSQDIIYEQFMVNLASDALYNDLFWIDVNGNVITSVVQQYTP
jgi:tetratricopeptide (TPR) repeat protein